MMEDYRQYCPYIDVDNQDCHAYNGGLCMNAFICERTDKEKAHITLSPHRCTNCYQVKKPGTMMRATLVKDEETGHLFHEYQCVECQGRRKVDAWEKRKDNIKLPDLGSWNRYRRGGAGSPKVL